MFFQGLVILCFSFIDFLSSDIPFSFDFLFSKWVLQFYTAPVESFGTRK